MPLGEADVRTIAAWLSPEYLIPAAREHGDGDPVRGAYDAYREVRGLIRNYARFVAHRDGERVAGLGLGLALRAMGYLGGPQPLGEEIRSDWRATAEATFTDANCAMTGEVVVGVGNAPRTRASLAAMLAVSRLLVFHGGKVNRARLQRRVFERTSPEILVHVETEPDEIRSVMLVPAYVHPPHRLGRRWLRALRGLKRLEDHWLRPLASQLLRAWGSAGFIHSPAGAMVSLVGAAGVQRGWAPLFPANGIPLAFTVARCGGDLVLGLTADHRVLDASACGLAYTFLQEEVPRCLQTITQSATI